MKKVLLLTFIMATLFCFTNSTSVTAESEKSSDKWLIYWYISGHDLEHKGANATKDMQEISRVTFTNNRDKNTINSKASKSTVNNEEEFGVDPEKNNDKKEEIHFPVNISSELRLSPNVKILIQTGGCTEWKNNDIKNNTIERYIYDSSGSFRYQGSFLDTSMGSADTLKDFLRYGKENIEKDFKPNHRMFIFWGHGGLVGVSYDERYKDSLSETRNLSGDFLDLNEIRQAFQSVYKSSPNNPPFEIIGFDSCLRATYENANNIYGFAKYMIASEEEEDSCGWYYSDWIKILSDNPSISSERLSEIICKSSYEFLQTNNDVIDYHKLRATFSTINLSPEKWLPLRTAHNVFMQKYFKSDDEAYTKLEAATSDNEMQAQSYPSEQKYMLDLKTFAEKAKEKSLILNRKYLLDAADDLINAVESAVVCKYNGAIHSGSSGISIYNPVYRSEENLKLYMSQNSIPKYTKNLYEELFLRGKKRSDNPHLEDNQKVRSKDSKKGNQSKGIQSFQEMQDLLLSELEDIDIDYDKDEGEIYLTNFSEDMRKKISHISGSLSKNIYANVGDKIPKNVRSLGDVSVLNDWNSDKVTCKLPTKWLTLNDHFVYTQILGSVNSKIDANGQIIQKGYTIYGVPIKLEKRNGDVIKGTLKVVYYPDESKYQILGASRSTEGSSVGSRETIIPDKGDKIIPLFMTLIPSENNVDNIKPAYSMRYGQSEFDLIWEDGESFTIEENLVANSKSLAVNPNDDDGNFAEYNISLELHSLGENHYMLSCPILFCIDEEGKIVEIDPDAYVGVFDAGDSIEITDHEEDKKYEFNTETGEVTEES